MNRVSAQSEDLRKMQQEAMRRVQEMQNKTQSYVRGSNDRFAGSFSLPRQNEQELQSDGINDYEKARERSQNVKQSQRVRASARQAQQSAQVTTPPIPPAEAQNQNEHTEKEQDCEKSAENRESKAVNSLLDIVENREKSEEKSSFGNNDIIIVLLILLLLNGNKSNSALILALASLFI